ncbi:hypothetical protein [Spirulina subsalsa]|uniref:hypothetical protein n=1 Tax=Spirulina subsalsa TaxID=54311 RepID=UPI0002FF3DDB|nr:hypothetical protein [Spirulina subsalsa]
MPNTVRVRRSKIGKSRESGNRESGIGSRESGIWSRESGVGRIDISPAPPLSLNPIVYCA